MKKIIDYIKNNQKKSLAIIVCSILVVGLAIIIPLTYKSAYCKHPIFDQERIKFDNPTDNEYINFELYATQYIDRTLDPNGSYVDGNLKVKTTLASKKKVIKNVSITFLLTSYWDKEWETNQSQTSSSTIDKITNGESLGDPTKTAYTDTFNIKIKKTFPFKPILFVTVEHPTLYVRVTFDIEGVTSTKTHTLYFEYEYEDYVNDQTKFE